MNCAQVALCVFLVFALSTSINAKPIIMTANAEGINAGATPACTSVCTNLVCQTRCRTLLEVINSMHALFARQRLGFI